MGRKAKKSSGHWIRARAMGTASGAMFARPTQGGEDFYLDMPDQVALDGDEILIRPTHRRGERPRATLESVEKRAHARFVASLDFQPHGKAREPRAIAHPILSRLPSSVHVEGDLLGARAGDAVLLRVTQWPRHGHSLVARVERALGSALSPQTLLLAAAQAYELRQEFPPKVVQCAEKAARKLAPVLEQGRRDLRKLRVFTIDGETAQDFDDAVSLTRRGEVWELGVHITDVSHYVAPGSPLDREAYARGTSVYLPGLTLPMLPEALSNGACSLRPGEDRLAMTVRLRIQNGAVLSAKIFPSLIRSRARLTYEAVNALFAGEETAVPKNLHKTLLRMRELSLALIEARAQRGALSLETAETQLCLDASGEPLDVIPRPSGDAERLIESFMLLANEAVAAYARARKLPFPYRVHEPSAPEDLAALNQAMAHFGYPPCPDGKPASLNGLLALARGKPEEPLVQFAVVRSMQKARYSEQPKGHFALALRDYCHFTSPIRRYPDLLAHRILKLALAGDFSQRERYKKNMPEWTEFASQREEAAASAERRATAMLCALWLASRVGESFEGVVSRVYARGARILLDNTCEGTLPLDALPGFWFYLPERAMLVSERANEQLQAGQRVCVRVAAVRPLVGEVDFAPEPLRPLR